MGIKISLPLFIQIIAAGIICSGCSIIHRESGRLQFDQTMLLITEPALVIDCKSLNEVSASVWGGLTTQGDGARQVKLHMLGTSRQFGGNVVYQKTLALSFIGANGTGQAYDCSESQLENARKAASTEIYSISGTAFNKETNDSPSPLSITDTSRKSGAYKLRELKKLLDENIITKQEHDAQKAKILSDGI